VQINPYVPYLKGAALEAYADDLLQHYGQAFEAVVDPPVPIEEIAELLLGLDFDWGPIVEQAGEPILGCLHPERKSILLNETRRGHFDQYPGSLEFTIAHEIGHYVLHLVEPHGSQQELPLGDDIDTSLYHRQGRNAATERREFQANKFAACLLMPRHLLRAAISDRDICDWDSLRQLARRFKVSLTALRIRLEDLGWLYVDPDGQLHRSQAEASGQMSLL
jgi:Zn-dependent peptidase ImmA (M78 family)